MRHTRNLNVETQARLTPVERQLLAALKRIKVQANADHGLYVDVPTNGQATVELMDRLQQQGFIGLHTSSVNEETGKARITFFDGNDVTALKIGSQVANEIT